MTLLDASCAIRSISMENISWTKPPMLAQGLELGIIENTNMFKDGDGKGYKTITRQRV
jgi:hypothetical protein